MTANKTLNAAISVPYAVMGRNKIINGDMRIDQRNAGASVTGNDTIFGVDRWVLEASQTSKMTMQQNAGSVTPPAGFTNYLGITSSSSYTSLATDYFNLVQRIEGYTVADLDFGKSTAKPVTISFWVRSSLTGTFGGSLRNASAGRSYPFTYTIAAVNTWEQKVITVPGDILGTWPTTNGSSMHLYFNLGCGSNFAGTPGTWASANYPSATGATSILATSGATWYITGVQLEAGSSASPFERRLYGQELALCQRYFFSIGPGIGHWGTAASTASFFCRMPVTMRATPAMTYSGTINVYVPGTATYTSTTQPSTIGTWGDNLLRYNIGGCSGTGSGGQVATHEGQTILVSAEL